MVVENCRVTKPRWALGFVRVNSYVPNSSAGRICQKPEGSFSSAITAKNGFGWTDELVEVRIQ